jgi:hypothetical protein
MDAMHWNNTLRKYPLSTDDNDISDYNYSVNRSGLIILSLSGNEFTDFGLEVIARTLRKNQWMMGKFSYSI